MGRKSRQKLIDKELRIIHHESQVAKRGKVLRVSSLVIVIVGLIAGGAFGYLKYLAPEKGDETQKIAVIETDRGTIRFALHRDSAPKTADNFIKLASEGFYDGTKFHRVISDFMIQGGDPLSKNDDPSDDGTGGPGYTFEDEINPWSLDVDPTVIAQLQNQGYIYDRRLASRKLVPAAVAMANSGPNTNGSQFFIVTESPQPHLDGKHTVFGTVVEGMEVVRSIQKDDVMKRVFIEDLPAGSDKKEAASTPGISVQATDGAGNVFNVGDVKVGVE